MTFEEANKVEHLVETQWHYPIMIKFNYSPLTKSAIGFVRSYVYENTNTNHKMTISTGYSCDYWTDNQSGDSGYHSSLKTHLNKLNDNKGV